MIKTIYAAAAITEAPTVPAELKEKIAEQEIKRILNAAITEAGKRPAEVDVALLWYKAARLANRAGTTDGGEYVITAVKNGIIPRVLAGLLAAPCGCTTGAEMGKITFAGCGQNAIVAARVMEYVHAYVARVGNRAARAKADDQTTADVYKIAANATIGRLCQEVGRLKAAS